jgi:hypothetical protein
MAEEEIAKPRFKINRREVKVFRVIGASLTRIKLHYTLTLGLHSK